MAARSEQDVVLEHAFRNEANLTIALKTTTRSKAKEPGSAESSALDFATLYRGHYSTDAHNRPLSLAFKRVVD